MMLKAYFRGMLFLLLVSGCFSCAGQEDEKPEAPAIRFKETRHAFMAMYPGEKRRHVFEYTNTGTAPLLILDVRPDCGCTIPYWDREALFPGETGRLAVYYDTDMTLPGFRQSRIWVVSNTPEPVMILLDTEILNFKNN